MLAHSKKNLFFVRMFFILAAAMFVACVATLPWMLGSVIDDLKHPSSEHKYPFTPEGIKPVASYSRLHVDVVAMDEINHVATLLVNGYHACGKDEVCGKYKERIVFFQVDESDAEGDSMPPSAAVDLPSSSDEITAKIQLPVRGNILIYPFDVYKLGIGVALQRVFPDNTVQMFTPEETKGMLLMTIQEQVPRTDLIEMKTVNPKSVLPKNAPAEYAYVEEMLLGRPPYLRVVVVLVTILSIMVTIFTMTTRPFNDLVLNAGALIFGIWGIRSLVLGGYPADVTLLDTILTALVVFMLLTLTFRGMNHFHETGNLRVLPWARSEAKPEAPKKECPECLTKVPAAAKRCSACTTVLV